MVYSTLAMIKRQMEVKDARYWSVIDAANSTIATSDNNSVANLGVQGSFEQLENVLKECTGDYVKVTVRTKGTDASEKGDENFAIQKGSSKYGPYFIQCTPANSLRGISGPINGAGSDIDLHRQIWQLEQALKDKDNESKYRELERKIEGLNGVNTNAGIFDKFLSTLAGNLADRFTGSEIKKALNKPEPEPARREPEHEPEHVSGADEEKEKNVVLTFLKNAGAAMGDEKTTLAAIAALSHMAQTKPAVFKETAMELINMASHE